MRPLDVCSQVFAELFYNFFDSKVLTKNEKGNDIPKLDQPLRSLSSPLMRTSAVTARKNLLASKSRESSGSDDDKGGRRLSADMRSRGVRGPKKDRKASSSKGRVLLAAINPSANSLEASPACREAERPAGGGKTLEKEKDKSRSNSGNKMKDKNVKRDELDTIAKNIDESFQQITLMSRQEEKRKGIEIEDSVEVEAEQDSLEDDSEIAEGITLPNCRTVVFPPRDIPLVSEGPPSSTLSLQYVRGYNSGVHTCGCKNVMYANNEHIVYPAANIVVVMNTESSIQGFFIGHSETVSSLTVHPLGRIVASGDASGLIFIYDISLLQEGMSSSRSISEADSLAVLNKDDGDDCSVHSLSFSSDGRLLVALMCDRLDESQSIKVYDWSIGKIITYAPLGHSAFRVAFDPYRDYMAGGCTPAGSPQSLVSSTDTDQEYEACYSMVSCGGRVVKFWTLTKQFNPLTSELSQQQDGGGCRECSYVLEGKAVTWPGGDETAADLTCFTFTCDRIADPQSDDDVATTSRVLCGSSSGSIYIWQQSESHSEEYIGQKSPLPKGKLISLVTDVHEGAVYDIDYFNANSNPRHSYPHHKSQQRQQRQLGGSETVLTCGSDGVANLWELERVKSLPLEHICACSLLRSDGSVSGGADCPGIASCISFSPDGRYAVIGSAGNSLMLLALSGDGTLATLSVDDLMSCHTGDIQRLVSQPVTSMSSSSSVPEQPCYYATVSRDNTVRVWDPRRCLEVASITLSNPDSVSFTPTGNALAVCTSSGELLIVGMKVLGSKKSDVSNDSEIILRKNIRGKPSSGANDDAAVGGGSRSFMLKYSPDGKVLAVTHGDNEIHLLSVRNSYKRLGSLKGHTASVGGFDFSSDSRILQSFDSSSDLMYWDVGKMERISDARVVRDVQWHSWCSPIGWSVQGVSNIRGPKRDTLPPPVCMSHCASLIAAGGSDLRLFNYPCLLSAIPSVCDAGTKAVSGLIFLPGDRELVTISKSDPIIFQWTVG